MAMRKQLNVTIKRTAMNNKDMDIDYDYRKSMKKIENDDIEKLNVIEKDYTIKSSIFFDSARKAVDKVFPKPNNVPKVKVSLFEIIQSIFKKTKK